MRNIRIKNGSGIFYMIDGKNMGVFGVSLHNKLEIPGGRYDVADADLVHTAVRESIEECGIHPKFYSMLVQYIKKNCVSTELKYGRGKYVIYFVKIQDFNLDEANAAASNRLNEFLTMGVSQKKLLSSLVEMKRFVLSDMGRRVKNVRNRDNAFINTNDFKKKMYYATINSPVFKTTFTFVDFNSKM